MVRRESFSHQPTINVRPPQKWNPVFWWGNEDDPEPPEWYRPGDPKRERKWYFRNPLHNFTFYVMGISDKAFDQTGRYPGEVFNPNQGWNWTVCRLGGWRLPLLSYQRGSFKWHIGWRERGNFGLKLNL